MAYKIKTVPEDFVVKEVITLDFDNSGAFSYYLLKKTNLSTIEAVDIISKKMNINKKFINYAGTKDKKAVTEQKISIKGGKDRNFDYGNIILEFLGKGKERINLGDNDGNYFEITARGIEKNPKEIKSFVNYFDDQRFSGKNIDIGRAIVKRDFEKAANLIIESDRHYEPVIKEYLDKNKKNFIGALRLVNKKVLTIFVHAYQSYLWNLCVSAHFNGKQIECSMGRLNVPEKPMKNFSHPIIGFGTESQDKVLLEVMHTEGITARDFVIKELPELTSEGSEREVFAEIKNLKIEIIDYRTAKISFELGKGSYATMAVKQMFI